MFRVTEKRGDRDTNFADIFIAAQTVHLRGLPEMCVCVCACVCVFVCVIGG